ncbi:chemotaxis protein CheB [Litoribrevibacter euphylliae]|uniref:protein-glutamate methylesterase n=1 Tax=Litoribrevibacter euphylliae TaxID=1834034 RepID=A0ABV7HFQ7_9GAMM
MNDSILHQKILLALLEQHGCYQCVGVAGDGLMAVRMNQEYRPDLILMDIHMPNMDGVTATMNIMNSHPTRILIVTCTVSSNVTRVFEAQAKGAMDVIKTPVVTLNGQGILTQDCMNRAGLQLFQKMDTLLKACVPHVSSTQRPQRLAISSAPTSPAQRLIVIGASTGGPNAVLKILAALTDLKDTAVVLNQHIDEIFAESFRLWLAEHTGLTICLAKNGQPLKSKHVYVAPGGRQSVTVTPEKQIKIVPTPAELYYSPSINLCMNSVAKVFGANALGVILTGMADDGAEGLLSMKQAGAITLAQTPDSCVVDSMPKSAQRIGAAQGAQPLDGIRRTIEEWIKGGRS